MPGGSARACALPAPAFRETHTERTFFCRFGQKKRDLRSAPTKLTLGEGKPGGTEMLKTIVLGSCVSVQGLLVRALPDGKVVVQVGAQIFAGRPV